MKKLKEILYPGLFPFTICFFFAIFIVFYNVLHLPSPSDLTRLVITWYGEHGLKLLFLAAFLEGVFIVGIYFPGSLAIALAVYTFGMSTIHLFYIGIIAFCGFLLSNILNYFLGRYGYYKFLLIIGRKDTIAKMGMTMEKYGYKTFFLTGFFPNFFAITSVCAGIARMKIFRVLLLQAASLVFWVTLWTIIGSMIVRKINLQDDNQSTYLLLTIFIWGVILIVKEQMRKKK